MKELTEEEWEKRPYYTCTECGGQMRSLYSGHFCACKCGASAVDQTRYYTRFIGNVERKGEKEE